MITFRIKTLAAAAALSLFSGMAATAATAAPLPAAVSLSPQSSVYNESGVFRDSDNKNPLWGRHWYSVNGGFTWNATNLGMFRLEATDGKGWRTKFNAFCIDVAQSLNLNAAYKTVVAGADSVAAVTPAALSPAVASNIGKLFANAYNDVKTSKAAVAFQLALWEITTEKGSKLSLENGSFQAGFSGFWDYSYRNMAEAWIEKLPTWTVEKRFVALVSPRSQDLLTNIEVPADPQPAPVPLPASGVLLFAGLAGLAAVRRRKA